VKAKRIVDKLLETDLDAPTPENVERLTPVLPIEDLVKEFERKLSLQQPQWQWYTDQQGHTSLLISGYVFGVKTSGEAYRSVEYVLRQKGITMEDFRYDEDDHEMSVWLPKHHVQAPPPSMDNSDDTGITNPNSWFNQP